MDYLIIFMVLVILMFFYRTSNKSSFDSAKQTALSSAQNLVKIQQELVNSSMVYLAQTNKLNNKELQQSAQDSLASAQDALTLAQEQLKLLKP